MIRTVIDKYDVNNGNDEIFNKMAQHLGVEPSAKSFGEISAQPTCLLYYGCPSWNRTKDKGSKDLCVATTPTGNT